MTDASTVTINILELDKKEGKVKPPSLKGVVLGDGRVSALALPRPSVSPAAVY